MLSQKIARQKANWVLLAVVLANRGRLNDMKTAYAEGALLTEADPVSLPIKQTILRQSSQRD